MENLHLINIKYLSATDFLGSRVRLTSLRFDNDSVILPFDYAKAGTLDIAYCWIHDRYGDDVVVGFGETPTGYIIAVNVFEPLRGDK